LPVIHQITRIGYDRFADLLSRLEPLEGALVGRWPDRSRRGRRAAVPFVHHRWRGSRVWGRRHAKQTSGPLICFKNHHYTRYERADRSIAGCASRSTRSTRSSPTPSRGAFVRVDDEHVLSLNAEYAKIWPNITVTKSPHPTLRSGRGSRTNFQYFLPNPGAGD
jgi:hypothetical protein